MNTINITFRSVIIAIIAVVCSLSMTSCYEDNMPNGSITDIRATYDISVSENLLDYVFIDIIDYTQKADNSQPMYTPHLVHESWQDDHSRDVVIVCCMRDIRQVRGGGALSDEVSGSLSVKTDISYRVNGRDMARESVCDVDIANLREFLRDMRSMTFCARISNDGSVEFINPNNIRN